MNNVHFILQGKGGIGKSLVASLLSQFIKTTYPDVPFAAFDTDQENTTFAHYKALGAKHVAVMNDSRVIDSKKFDDLIEGIVANNGVSVVDNGANTFGPLVAYMVENAAFNMLKEAGKNVFIHSIVGGGDTFSETAHGFVSIVKSTEQLPVVLWRNEFFGKLENKEGVDFAKTKTYANHESRIIGTICLESLNPQTYGEDIKKMNTARLTFEEIFNDNKGGFRLMEQQRLKNFQKSIFGQLRNLPI